MIVDLESLGLLVEHFNKKQYKWFDKKQLNKEEEIWYKQLFPIQTYNRFGTLRIKEHDVECGEYLHKRSS